MAELLTDYFVAPAVNDNAPHWYGWQNPDNFNRYVQSVFVQMFMSAGTVADFYTTSWLPNGKLFLNQGWDHYTETTAPAGKQHLWSPHSKTWPANGSLTIETFMNAFGAHPPGANGVITFQVHYTLAP